jgi:NitT/TauT family transport system substrate-binding protein
MTQPTRLRHSVLAALLLGAATGPALSQEELTDVTLRLAWIAGGVDAPFFAADALGYFEEEGLDVEITDGNGSNGTIIAMTNGDFDIGIAGLGVLAQAQATMGMNDLVAVAGLVQKDPSSIIALEGSGITAPADIAGRRFGTSADNLQDGMINAFAEANGIDMDSIEIVIVNGSNDRNALLQGDVDFINGWANPDGDKVAAISPIEEPILFADYGVNILGSSVIVRRDWLEENPDVVRGFLAAVVRAKDYVEANPEEARDMVMAQRPDVDPDQILADITTMPRYEHTAASEGMGYGAIAEEDILQTISLLEQYSGVEPGLSPADLYTADYLPAAD